MKKKDSEHCIIILTAMRQGEIFLHPRVVIKFPGKHGANIIKGKTILEAMTGNPWFANIPGMQERLIEYESDIETYIRAESNVKLRKPGARGKRDVVNADFCSIKSEKLREIVQGVCNKNKVHSLEIARSAGMDLQGPGGRSDQQWKIEKDKVKGIYKLSAVTPKTKSKRYCIQWQRTLMPEVPDSWYLRQNEIIPTLKASAEQSGLPIKETVYFRYRSITDKGVSDWSDVISVIIT